MKNENFLQPLGLKGISVIIGMVIAVCLADLTIEYIRSDYIPANYGGYQWVWTITWISFLLYALVYIGVSFFVSRLAVYSKSAILLIMVTLACIVGVLYFMPSLLADFYFLRSVKLSPFFLILGIFLSLYRKNRSLQGEKTKNIPAQVKNGMILMGVIALIYIAELAARQIPHYVLLNYAHTDPALWHKISPFVNLIYLIIYTGIGMLLPAIDVSSRSKRLQVLAMTICSILVLIFLFKEPFGLTAVLNPIQVHPLFVLIGMSLFVRGE